MAKSLVLGLCIAAWFAQPTWAQARVDAVFRELNFTAPERAHAAWAAIAELTDQLKELSEAEREGEVLELARWIGDLDPTVAQTAREMLGSLGEQAAPAIPRLLEALDAARSSHRFSAIEALTQIGPAAVAAVPRLLEMDVDGADINLDQGLRRFGEAAVPALLAGLHSASPRARGRAAGVLADYPEAASTVVPALAALLQDDACSESALRALAAIGARAAPAVPQLQRLVEKGGERAREACHVLGALGEAAVPALPAMLALFRAQLWNGTALRDLDQALTSVGGPAVPLLIPLLECPDDLMRARVADILGAMGERAAPAVAALERLLYSEGPPDLQAAKALQAGMALARIRTDAAKAALWRAALGGAPHARLSAVLALGDAGVLEPEQILKLGNLLQHREAPIRRAAAVALAKTRSPLAFGDLVCALSDSDAGVREDAAAGLPLLGDVSVGAVAPLVQLLDDPESTVRWAAMDALGQIAPRVPAVPKRLVWAIMHQQFGSSAPKLLWELGLRAVPGLVEVIDRGAPASRVCAFERLTCIVGYHAMSYPCEALAACERAPAAFEVALVDPDADIRRRAATLCGFLGRAGAPVLPALLRATHDTAPEVAEAALHAAGGLGIASDEVVTTLVAALQDADESRREAAAKGLRNLGVAALPAVGALLASMRLEGAHRQACLGAIVAIGPAAFPALREGLRSGDEGIRAAAIAAFDDQGPRVLHALEALVVVIKRDPSPSLRLKAAFAIAQTPWGREAIPVVVRAIGHADPTIRTHARALVRQFGGWAADEVRRALADPDPAVRSGAEELADAVGARR